MRVTGFGRNEPTIADAATPEPTAASMVAAEETPAPDLTPEPEAPNPLPTEYAAGQYTAGADMRAGEYLLTTNPDAEASVFIVLEIHGEQETVLATESFVTHTLLTLDEGQTVRLVDCRAKIFDPAERYWQPDGGSLKPGMYRAGGALPPSTYALISTGEHGGYWELSRDSKHDGDSVIQSGNFSGETEITLEDGVYIKLLDAELRTDALTAVR